MKNLFFIVLFFISLIVNSQNKKKIDSLQNLISITSNPIEKGNLTLKLSEITQNSNPELSLTAAENAVVIGKSTNASILSKAYFQLGYLNYNKQKDSEAILYFNKLDSVINKNDTINDVYIKSKLYRAQISKFTYTIEGLMRGKEYLNEMLLLAKKANNKRLEHLAYSQIGDWYATKAQVDNKEKNADTAKIYFNRALDYFVKTNDNEYILRVYQDLYSIEFQLQKDTEAEIYLFKKLELAKTINDSIELAKSNYLIGRFYRIIKNPSKGLPFLKKASEIYSKTGFPNNDYELMLYTNFSLSYADIGDYKNAYNYEKASYMLKDSIDRNRSRSLAIEMEAKYQNQEKEQEIALLTSQNELAKQRQKNQRNIFIAGLGLTTLAGLFFFFQYRNRQKTNSKLKELDQAKSTFFANISHEFRTPLTLIKGPIEDQLLDPNTTQRQRRNLTYAKQNTQRLEQLVDQLLVLSKLESGHFKLQVQQGSIAKYVNAYAEAFTFSSQEKGIIYNIDIKQSNTQTWFDRDALEKIVFNLIGNAIKYTPDNETITIAGNVTENYFTFNVTNTGVSIADNVKDKIFTRFYQAGTKNTGVGIGLALTKELTELHKGSIKLTSDKNKTIFSIKLPIAKKYYSEKEIVYEELQETTILDTESVFSIDEETIDTQDAPVLLIVDDNKHIREYITSIFEDEYEIYTASNGKKGMETALKNIPDIVISDLMMPTVDGYKFTETLKENELTSHIPVLLLTAKTEDVDKLKATKIGADAYLTKPFNSSLLKAKVFNLLESRRKLQIRFSQEVILKPKDISISNADELFLEKLQKVIDHSVTKPDFTTDTFSNEMGVSRMQLHRKLKALTGLSTTAFIKSQRLKIAITLLKKGGLSVSEIGYAVGFSDPSYFTKCFKKEYGVAPSDYSI